MTALLAVCDWMQISCPSVAGLPAVLGHLHGVQCQTRLLPLAFMLCLAAAGRFVRCQAAASPWVMDQPHAFMPASPLSACLSGSSRMVGLGRLGGRSCAWVGCVAGLRAAAGALAGRLGTTGGLVGRTVSEGVTFTVTQHVVISGSEKSDKTFLLPQYLPVKSDALLPASLRAVYRTMKHFDACPSSQAHLHEEQAMQREQRAGRVRVHHAWQLDDVLHWGLYRHTLDSYHGDSSASPLVTRSAAPSPTAELYAWLQGAPVWARPPQPEQQALCAHVACPPASTSPCTNHPTCQSQLTQEQVTSTKPCSLAGHCGDCRMTFSRPGSRVPRQNCIQGGCYGASRAML